MKNITVNQEYTEIIPLPNELSTATLAYTVVVASDGSGFDTGNLEYITGIQWKMAFTPTTLDEIYIIEVENGDGDIVFSESYKALGDVTTEAEGVSIAATKVETVNKALTLIGASSITSLNDDTQNARVMNRIYKTSLRSLLSECLWNFAKKRVLLTESADELDWYYTNEAYVYQRPSDVIRIFGTNDDSATWREEGDYIISDTAGLGIIYVYYLDIPYKYPPSFIEAFVHKLAAEAACTLLGASSTKAREMLEMFEKVSLPKARSESAQVGTQQTQKDDAWELAKYSNSNPDA